VAYFADLSRYTYCEAPGDAPAVNVGWLDGAHDYVTGDVPPEFVHCLLENLRTQRVHAYRGWQECEMCFAAGDRTHPTTIEVDGRPYPLGDADILITSATGMRYDAPNLIYHYVVAHHYRPPDEFITAVLGSELRR